MLATLEGKIQASLELWYCTMKSLKVHEGLAPWSKELIFLGWLLVPRVLAWLAHFKRTGLVTW